jgi:hypothetical protein
MATRPRKRNFAAAFTDNPELQRAMLEVMHVAAVLDTTTTSFLRSGLSPSGTLTRIGLSHSLLCRAILSATN